MWNFVENLREVKVVEEIENFDWLSKFVIIDLNSLGFQNVVYNYSENVNFGWFKDCVCQG